MSWRIVILFAAALLGRPALAQHEQHQHAAALAPSGVLDDIVVDFALLDVTGATVTPDDFRGRYVLLGFGFTHCVDVCPIMVANMAFALQQTVRPAVGIFVSVDTERDDVARTHGYASAFGGKLLGLGGTAEQVAAAARNFKVRYVVTKTEQTTTVQHTNQVYLIDPDGELLEAFGFDATPATMAAAIQ